MNNSKKSELISETTREYNIRRFREGLKEITHDPRKQVGIPAVLGTILLLGYLMQKYVITEAPHLPTL